MVTESGSTIAIIGAGQAGSWVARTMRTEGFAGRIVLIGEERHPPYERPPLSKRLLTAACPPAPATLLSAADCAAQGIELITSTRVTGLDLARRTMALARGETIAFTRLVMATGSTVRRLPVTGADTADLAYLRTYDDALALHQRLEAAPRTVIIGGGFLGLEVASSARRRGCVVTVLEASNRLLNRSTLPAVSDLISQVAKEEGVALKLGCRIERIEKVAAGTRIVDHSGEQWFADLVVVGIGALPATELAVAAGLEVGVGIVVDEQGRTSHPDVFAVGDVTYHPNRYANRRIHLESWQNAQNQAIAVGSVLAGHHAVHDDVPWFWSDQFGLNFQILGLPANWDRVLTRGRGAARDIAVFLLKEDRIVGVHAINRPRDILQARKLVAEGAAVDLARLAEEDVPLTKAVR